MFCSVSVIIIPAIWCVRVVFRGAERLMMKMFESASAIRIGLFFCMLTILVFMFGGCENNISESSLTASIAASRQPSIESSSADSSSTESLIESSKIVSSKSSSKAVSSKAASSKKAVSSTISLPKINTIGNSVGNIYNDGRMAYQGEWIFYRNDEDNGKLYKVKIDGTNRIVVDKNSTYVNNINIVGDDIYYSASTSSDNYLFCCLCKIKADGSGFVELEHPENDRYSSLYVIDNTLYMLSFKEFRAMNPDGTIKKIYPKVLSFVIYNNIIYYMENSEDDIKISQMNLMGDDNKFLLSFKKDSDYFGNEICGVSNGWIYYKGNKNSLMRYNISSSKTEKVLNVCYSIIVQDDWIFFDDDSSNICRMKSNDITKKETLKASIGVFRMFIISDWLYYIADGAESGTHKMKFDSSHDQFAEEQLRKY